MLVLCGFLIALAERHNHRFDLTPQKAFVLSDQAKKIAASVKDPVQILVFYNGAKAGRRRQIADLIEQFVTENPRISLQPLRSRSHAGSGQEVQHRKLQHRRGREPAGDGPHLAAIDESEIAGSAAQGSTDARSAHPVLPHRSRRAQPQKTISDRSGYSDVGKALEKENYAIKTIEMVPSPAVICGVHRGGDGGTEAATSSPTRRIGWPPTCTRRPHLRSRRPRYPEVRSRRSSPAFE